METSVSSATSNFYGVGNTTGESGGDANAALNELDQNLRCGRLGEQAEAIVRFPRLFAKYPFPILINSALLKLADVFRQGSNFLKLCVLCVVRQSERHLDKITNVDEFIKRVFAVIHSNDPVARALTLRTLGAVASIIPERKQAHHSIRHALDSQDSVELRAAIYAASRFAARSKCFAVNMCEKISDMIKGYSTPPEMKLRLIPMFQHMHHDAHTAQIVRQTCIEMLPDYPSEEFVLVTLRTLTRLSAHTLVDVPEQVELLLKHLDQDSRKGVMRQVLSDLRFLANDERAHLWSAENVASLLSFAEASVNEEGEAIIGALSILCDLIKNTSIGKVQPLEANSLIIKLTQQCCYSSQLSVAGRATQLVTLIATNCIREAHTIENIDISSEAVMAIEALFLLISSENALQRESTSSRKVLKECLLCVVQLCQVHPRTSDQFVDIVGGLLLTSSRETVMLLCETLASFASMKRGVLKLLLPDICNAINTVIESEVDTGSTAPVLTLLTSMLFQTLRGHSWPESCSMAVKSAVGNVDQWSAYCIGRSASRYGHHGVAADIFQRISYAVSSEHYYFWLTGLNQISHGEHLLNDVANKDLVDRLSLASSRILEGLSSIRAASTQNRSQEFQVEYLKCRSDFLQALSQLVYTCHSLRTSPPPAIANSQAKVSADDLQKCGRVTSLLRGCVSEFNNVGAAYGELYSSSFDGDPDTLAHIHIFQHLCHCIAQWIEMVCLKSSRQGTLYEDIAIAFTPSLIDDDGFNRNLEIQDLLCVGEQVADCFRQLVANPATPQPITDAHTTCLLNVINLLTTCQMGIPRLFFQSLQQTNLKLAVTPQPRSGNEPIGVPNSQHMAIKVEGVITTSTVLPKQLRSVKSIRLLLSSQLQNPAAKVLQTNEKIPDCSQSLEQIVEPHNDFFTIQFLLPFTVPGTHQVTIETRLIDEDGQTWNIGVKTSLAIKSFEDATGRPQGVRSNVNR